MFSSYNPINSYDNDTDKCNNNNQSCIFLPEFYKDTIIKTTEDFQYINKIQKYDFYCENEIKLYNIMNNQFPFIYKSYLNILVGYKRVNIKEVDYNDCVVDNITNNVISPNHFVLLIYKKKCTISLYDFLTKKNHREIEIFKKYIYNCLKYTIDFLIEHNIIVINFDILLDITGFSVMMSNFSRAFVFDKTITNERKTTMNKYYFNSYDIKRCIYMPVEYHLLCFMNHTDIEVLSRNNIIQFIYDYNKYAKLSISENEFICKYVNCDFDKIIKTIKQWPLQQLEKMVCDFEI